MSSIQEKISIAFTCRRALQGLKEKIRDLPPESKTEDSRELHDLMSDVAAIVGDDTVVEAVKHCDTDLVRLLVDEKEFRSHLNIPAIKHEVKEEVDEDEVDWQNVNNECNLDDPLSTASGNCDSDEDRASNEEVDLNRTMIDVKEEHAPYVVAIDSVLDIPAITRKASSHRSVGSEQTLPPVNVTNNMPVPGSYKNEENLGSNEVDLDESMLGVKEDHAPYAVAIDSVVHVPAVERAPISHGSSVTEQTLTPDALLANIAVSDNSNSDEKVPTHEEFDLDESMLEVDEEPPSHTVIAISDISVPAIKREAISNGSKDSDRTLPPAQRAANVPQMTKATSLATTVDLFSQEDCASQPALSQESSVSQRELNVVDDLLDSLDESVHVDHMNDILQRKVIYKSPRFYEILGGEESQSVYYVMPGINYCYCDRFQAEVLGSHEEFTCVHVMAAWMAEALGACRIAPTSVEKLATVVKLLEERAMDYH